MEDSIFSFSATSLNGDVIPLENFRGQALLIVNTASKGNGKYELAELQRIQDVFDASQFRVLSFPCSQFLRRESKHEAKIRNRYKKFTFPVFQLTAVNGESAHPLFSWLKDKAPGDFGKTIEWNFTKFLVSPDGTTVTRFSSTTTTQKVIAQIQNLIPSPPTD